MNIYFKRSNFQILYKNITFKWILRTLNVLFKTYKSLLYAIELKLTGIEKSAY
jgi:hypothetical protein